MRHVSIVCAIALVAACSAPDRTSRAPQAPSLAKPPGLRLPATAVPLAYDLRLDVDPDSEVFRGEVAIRVRLEAATDHVWLHADDLDILTAYWDQGPLGRADVPGEQMIAFRFGRVVAPGTVTLRFTYRGRTTGQQEGLFRQRAGAWYVFSQGEAVFARRITPCFDEPRFKTPWKVTLIVPRKLVALSNMPEASTTVLGRTKEVAFAESPPLPSYLLAIAVGPFDLVDAGTVGRAKVPVRVAVAAGRGKRTAVVPSRLPQIVDAIERYLDEPLPLAKLDIVAVPEFFGAMENPGLITMHEPIVIGDPKRDSFADYFTLIAAHELAHQWFGNLVTPAWWDHLWLSEAFASWLGDKLVRELNAYDDAPLRHALARREAIDADHARDAQPLWRHVATTEEADEGFDSIAYSKGQVVLGTFESFLGADAFRAAVRAYLASFRGRTITSTDAIRALSTATSASLGAALQRHVAARATPVVELALRCDGAAVLAARAIDEPIPLCVSYASGTGTARACKLVDGATELPLGPACPPWVHANPDGGYYHTRWTTHGPRGPARKIADLDPASRVIAGDELAAAARRGELTATEAVSELRALTSGNDPYGELGAVALALALDAIIDDASRPAWNKWLASRFAHRLALEKRPPVAVESEVVQALIALAPASSFSTTITRRAHVLLDTSLPDVYGELPPGLVKLAAVHGGNKLFERLALRARVLRDDDARDSWLDNLGEFPPAQLPKAIALVTGPELPAAAAWRAVARYLERPATRTAAWRAVKTALPDILRRMSAAESVSVIDALAHQCDPTTRDDIAAAFAGRAKTIPDGPAHLATTLARIDACIARRATLGDLPAALSASR